VRLIVEREMLIRAFVPQSIGRFTRCWMPGSRAVRSQAFKHKGEDIAVSNQESADKMSLR